MTSHTNAGSNGTTLDPPLLWLYITFNIKTFGKRQKKNTANFLMTTFSYRYLLFREVQEGEEEGGAEEEEDEDDLHCLPAGGAGARFRARPLPRRLRQVRKAYSRIVAKMYRKKHIGQFNYSFRYLIS